MKRYKSSLGYLRIPAFLITLVLFALINLVLFIGQEFGRDAEKKELEELNTKLAQLKQEVETLELNISFTEEKLKEADTFVNQCKAGIVEFESQAVNGALPSQIYTQYTLAVDNCNAQVRNSNNLINSYNTLYEQYDRVIQTHNVLVTRANELAKSLGTKYYIVPRRFH